MLRPSRVSATLTQTRLEEGLTILLRCQIWNPFTVCWRWTVRTRLLSSSRHCRTSAWTHSWNLTMEWKESLSEGRAWTWDGWMSRPGSLMCVYQGFLSLLLQTSCLSNSFLLLFYIIITSSTVLLFLLLLKKLQKTPSVLFQWIHILHVKLKSLNTDTMFCIYLTVYFI